MNRFKLAACISIVTMLAATSMFALYAGLKPSAAPRTRLLFIAGGNGEHRQRSLAGARAAARKLDIDLEVRTPNSDSLVEEQTALVQGINPGDYDGVALSPADPASQIELINELAGQTKLVTVDRDCDKSQRLCHIGFCPASGGGLVARLVAGQLSRSGKVALLASTTSDDALNARVSERLAGFKERWGSYGPNSSLSCPLVEIVIDTKNSEYPSHDLSATLADPELVFVIAFDANAAESALEALAARPGARHVPMVAFDPSAAIFDAIDDGRVTYAIFDDPYRYGFEAIQRLDAMNRADVDGLPMPGRGFDFLASEVVEKENLAEFRRRTRS